MRTTTLTARGKEGGAVLAADPLILPVGRCLATDRSALLCFMMMVGTNRKSRIGLRHRSRGSYPCVILVVHRPAVATAPNKYDAVTVLTRLEAGSNPNQSPL